MEDTNIIIISGKLFTVAKEFTYGSEKKTGMYFMINTSTRGSLVPVNVMIYNSMLISTAKNYIIPANTGRRLMIAGSVLLRQQSGKGTVVNADKITFIDDFITQDAAEKKEQNKIDFSAD